MKVSYKGRRQKGKSFERFIASQYRHYHIDDTAQAMPMSGAMEFHKGDILKKRDTMYVDECKNAETVKLHEWWRQAQAQAFGLQIPILHIKRNYTPPLTVMDTDTYFQMRKEIKDLTESLEELKDAQARGVQL
jgi:hypothetical protein